MSISSQSLSIRLLSWKYMYVSLDGRVILLNFVLNVIPIFFLSYMKMSVNVWKKIVNIQRRFLWGGLKEESKISWVKWHVSPHRQVGVAPSFRGL